MKKLSSSCPTTIFWPTSSLSYKSRRGRLWRHHLSSSPFYPSQWSFSCQVRPIQLPFYSGIKYCLLNQQIAKKLPPACDRIVFNSFRVFHPVTIQTSINQPEDHQYCILYFWVPLEEMARVLVQPIKSCKSVGKLIKIIILSNSEIKLVINLHLPKQVI